VNGGNATYPLLLLLVGLAIVLRTAKGSGSGGGSHLIAAVRRWVG
jgi:hypothetical protein